MLTSAIIIFAIAAIGGLLLAINVLSGRLAPWPLGIMHALLGATGLLLLVFVALGSGGGNRLFAALALLVLATLGGFYLLSLHLKEAIAPKAVVVVHASFAVLGFLTLLSLLL